ncbi:MAG: hypothetical protein EPO28_16395 [Saprospiraceae bacterium]|nr:MAG: hypothetical protein EPO28_16395 [Saprospiraceae bacterium]
MKMTPHQSTYQAKVYRDFRAIEPKEWRTIVRYFEEYQKEIRELEFEAYFEMVTAYTNALFEIGAYEKNLRMADTVIELSVMNNVRFFNGEDVFHTVLFKKAASCYHTYQLEKADYILRELLRIDPYDNDASMFLKKCIRKMHPSFVRKMRAAAILSYLTAALFICIEFLVIHSFYPQFKPLFEGVRNGVFSLGCIFLIAGDVIHRWRSNREVDDFVAIQRRRKRR